jgi:FHS family glucose/mannose:H+ symporter-like MFS transporter
VTTNTRGFPPTNEHEEGPSVPWLVVGFFLAGLGTVVLGPVLPAVAHRWGLTDAVSGTLFLAKFIGSFLGGVSVSRKLRQSLVLGALLSGAGFAAFAFAPGIRTGAACLAVAGFGLGQLIASTNILAGRRFRAHTGSALSAANFFFSLGAVLTGVLAGILLPRFGLNGPLVGLAGLLIVCGLGTVTSSRSSEPSTASEDAPATATLTGGAIAAFALLLFLYGGLETSLSSWLTTFSLRFGGHQLLGGQEAVILFWLSLTAGRAVSSALLRWVSERAVQAAGLVAVAVLTAMLAFGREPSGKLPWMCVALGLALAPCFPVVFAMLMRHRPSSRIAGVILAVSGLGAALFPWMIGVLSTKLGSLRTAMLVPTALALLLVMIGQLPPVIGKPARS